MTVLLHLLSGHLIAMADCHRISVHRALGGGSVADVLLWRKWCGSSVLLVSATTLWLLFERAGYNLLSSIPNVVLVLVVILFFWAKSASLLNRPLPRLPDLQVSDEFVLRAFDVLQVWIDRALSIASEIAVDGNLKVFLEVACGLWVIFYIGSFSNFLTLAYAGILLSSSVPVVYNKHQDRIDEKLIVLQKNSNTVSEN